MTFRTLALGAALAALPPTALAQQPPRGEIETQALAQLDAWTVGVLTPQQGALARDMWAHTDPDALAAVLARLPASYESPAALALARRALLSGAEAPRGDANEAARQRFEALGKMGASDDLALMAAGAAGAAGDPLIAQYAAQAELARGRRAEACARGRSAQSGPQAEPTHFILRLRAFCAASGGDRAAADLALELARTSGGDDPWYGGAIGVVAGATTGRPSAARYDNSLSAAISLAANLRPGANPLANASTMALLTLARDDTTPQPIRAQAAALAFRRGALTPAEARNIFAATPAELTSALPPLVAALRQLNTARAAAPAGAPAAAAPPAPNPMVAAAAIAAALRQAANPAEFNAAARLLKDDIAALAQAPDTAGAVLYARAALSVGDTSLAQRLIESARAAGAEQAALAPLEAALAVLQNARGPNAQAAVQRRIDAGVGAQARGAARDIAMMAAAGFPVDGAAQRFLLANAPQGGARADAGAMVALDAAVERSALGEVALLAVVASGDGIARLDADSAAQIVRALRQARLNDDARRFAVEAILAGAPS